MRVTALSDPDAKFLRAWARSIGGVVGQYASLEEMLAAESPPEALLIDLPVQERPAAILAAVPRCRGILCAVPFAPTIEETDRLIHAAETHEVALMPAFFRRHDPVLAHALELAMIGEIGLVQQMRCDWSFPLTSAFGAELGADPDARSWGTLLEIAGCHAADACRWAFGDVLSVSADIDEHDPAATIAGRRDNGPLLANLVLGHEEGPSTCHFSRSRSIGPFERYVFTGSLGQIEALVAATTLAADAFPALSLRRQGAKPTPIAAPEFEDADLPAPAYRARALLDRFVEVLDGGEPQDAVPQDARAALEVIHAAELSARDGRKIGLPLRRSPSV